MTAAPLGGTCDPQFAAVRDAFAENFASRGDLGAAVCVVVDGVRVADLWGGWADEARTRAWEPDTLVNVFSVAKPVATLAALRLVEQGALDLDAPLARVWPDFEAGGKAGVTMRAVLAHRAGLPALRRPLPADAMTRWDVMCEALAAETPWWEPGSAHGYHVNTYGFLAGEVVRRVSGRSLGAVLRDDIAGPLGADLHLGVGPDLDPRIADSVWPAGFVAPDPLPDPLPGAGSAGGAGGEGAEDREGHDDGGDSAVPVGFMADLAGDLMIHNAYFNPPGLSGAGVVNTRAWRAAEIPSTNAHGSARGVARWYEALVGGGAVDGVRIVDRGLLAEAVTEQSAGDDLVLRRPSRFGLGFQLTQEERPLGPNPRAFGHFGAGGSLGFCDPDAGVAFGYVMNRLGARWRNPLNRALIDALYSSL